MIDDIDIVQIEPDVFLSLRSLVTEEDQRITAKLKSVLETYSCFKENIPSVSTGKFSGSPHPSHHYTSKPYNAKGKFHNHHGFIPHPRPQRLTFTSSCDKDAMGLLNKLSPKNKDMIIQKLMRVCFQKTNVNDIVYQIIDKSFRHKTYMMLFMDVLEEVKKRYPSELRTTVDEFLVSYVDNFRSVLETFRYEPIIEAYDEYCSFIKEKDLFLSKFHLFLVLASTYDPTVMDTMLERLDEHIDTRDLTPLSCHVIVEMATILHKTTKSQTHIQDLLVKLEKLKGTTLMKKTVFKIQDLLRT